MQLRRSLQSFIPALILAALVVFVFSTLQNYGPESAVRRFHEGIIRRDGTELDEVTVEPKNGQEVGEIQLMKQEIYSRLVQGYRIRLQDLQRTPSLVDVTVVYYDADGTQMGNAPYVAVKTTMGWKVDVHRTWRLWNSFSSPRQTNN